MTSNDLLKHLKGLAARATPSGIFNLQDYIGTRHAVLNIPNPTLRKVAGQGLGMQDLDDDAQWKHLEQLWFESGVWDIMSIVLYSTEKRFRKADKKQLFIRLVSFLDRVDNWAHSDFISSLFGKLAAHLEDDILALMRRWNTSKKSWERRQSVVIISYYLRNKKQSVGFHELVALVTPLHADTDYFVQKGVGWALRDLGKKYPDEQLAYLNEFVCDLSAPAYATAVEKIKPEIKDELKARRKAARKNKK